MFLFSSVSSSANSVTALIWEDFLAERFPQYCDGSLKSLRIMKLLSISIDH